MLPPAGLRVELEGTCNRCGLCCVIQHEGHTLVCEYLKADLGPERQAKPLGTSEASRCGIYEQRQTLSSRSPIGIRMLDHTGTARVLARCFKDTWQEDHVIVERGIGKGCSLSLKTHEAKLVKFTPAER